MRSQKWNVSWRWSVSWKNRWIEDLELKKQFHQAIDHIIAECESRGDYVQGIMLQVQREELQQEIDDLEFALKDCMCTVEAES